MFFNRHAEIWTARSADGLTWTEEEFALVGADGDVVTLPDGDWRMFLGGRGQVGGTQFIMTARRVSATWGATLTRLRPLPSADYHTFTVAVRGSASAPITLTVTDTSNNVVTEFTPAAYSTEAPFTVVMDVPLRLIRGQFLLVDLGDVEIARQLKIS